eukprot:14566993-Heterocapsa_arctica.AAC.1
MKTIPRSGAHGTRAGIQQSCWQLSSPALPRRPLRRKAAVTSTTASTTTPATSPAARPSRSFP